MCCTKLRVSCACLKVYRARTPMSRRVSRLLPALLGVPEWEREPAQVLASDGGDFRALWGGGWSSTWTKSQLAK